MSTPSSPTAERLQRLQGGGTERQRAGQNRWQGRKSALRTAGESGPRQATSSNPAGTVVGLGSCKVPDSRAAVAHPGRSPGVEQEGLPGRRSRAELAPSPPVWEVPLLGDTSVQDAQRLIGVPPLPAAAGQRAAETREGWRGATLEEGGQSWRHLVLLLQECRRGKVEPFLLPLPRAPCMRVGWLGRGSSHLWVVGSVLVEALLPSQKVAFQSRSFLPRFLRQIRFRCLPPPPHEDERPLSRP